MTKNLIAVLAATMTTASMAVVDITGNYEGTFTDGNPGAASYAQDLDLTLVGTSGASTVTVMMEDLTGGTAVTANQVFVETAIEGIALKAGNYKNQNGSGLMQKTSAVTNQFEVSTSIAGAGITLGQVSEASKVTVDASLEVAELDVTVQNVTATDRFITVVANFLGLGVTAETQNTTVGRNTAVSATTTVGGLNATTVVIDVNDATAMSQDDGILGDISTAVNGKKVVGGVLSTATTIGTVTGKAFEMNDAMTYTGEIERGALTVGYTKADNTEGVTSAEINVAF
ncbi:MAG: hypothetical protein HOC17_05065 [Candidatus Ruthia sp.]|jgi:hypothetical protein|nr:hypothetical protein [Candidatus Ruthturnera sp.]